VFTRSMDVFEITGLILYFTLHRVRSIHG